MLDVEGDGWWRSIASGASVRFGRSGDGVDLPLGDDPRLHRRCGLIVVGDQGWELHNTGRWLRLRILGLDRPGGDLLLPGESALVPWRRCRVQVHTGRQCHEFTASYETVPLIAPPAAPWATDPDLDEGHTGVPIEVDRGAAYFRTLVALCEPQLLDPSSDDVATDLRIAWRLNGCALETRRVTGKTVERRLDHCRTRFGLKEPYAAGGAGLEQRDSRRRLASLALLTGTVTVADLAVLAAPNASVTPVGPCRG